MNLLIICLIFPLFLVLRILTYITLNLNAFVPEPLLFSQLMGKAINLSPFADIGFGLINLILMIFISKKLLGSKLNYIPPLLYAVSPWSIYLEVGGSLYIPVLTFFLLMFVSLKSIKNHKLSLSLFLLSSVCMVYSSILIWFTLPFLVFSLVKLNYLPRENLRVYLLALFIFCLPLAFITFKNIEGIENIYSKQVSIFSEVGLINTVNVFRGETSKTKWAILGRFVENRYFYLSEHFVFNLLKHLSPVAYFTPEFKIYDFSFSPPIFVGFLLPFLFGLKNLYYLCLKNKWLILTIFSLILPSLLSKNSPDLNRLILVSPGIFILISLGFTQLLNTENKWGKILLVMSITLILLQLFITSSDIYMRENIRLFQIKNL
jgi:hypothetical protein